MWRHCHPAKAQHKVSTRSLSDSVRAPQSYKYCMFWKQNQCHKINFNDVSSRSQWLFVFSYAFDMCCYSFCGILGFPTRGSCGYGHLEMLDISTTHSFCERSTIFWNAESYMDCTSQSSAMLSYIWTARSTFPGIVDLYMDWTVHTFWYVDLYIYIYI